MATTASLVIDFGGIADALLTAELDSIRNNGKTTFQAGDPVYFKVYSSVNYQITPSSGTVAAVTSDETEDVIAEVVSFIGSGVASTAKRVIQVLSYLWFDTGNGNNYGNITVSNHNEVAAETADENSVGVAQVSYRSQYDVWKLTPPLGMASTYHIAVQVKAVS